LTKEVVQAAKVGALVVAALVAAFFLYRAVDETSARGDGYRVYALMDNAQGLITKSRVTIAGISVGRIESIRLEGNQARIDLRMDEGVALYEDATVQRTSASLLGEYLIAIAPGTVGRRQLADGDRIGTVVETAGMGDILDDVGAIASSVRQVARQLEVSFGTDEAGRQMTDALRNLSEALATVNTIIQQNQEIVNHTLENIERITDDARPDLHEILDNISAITDQIRGLVERNQGDIDRGIGEVDDTVASIHRASDQLENVLADLGEITERTAAGEGTVGRLTSDDHLIDEVEASAEGLSDFIGGITRLRTIVELRSEYSFLANSFKNYFTFRVLPREGRYFYIQLIDDPRGRTQRQSVQVRRSPVAPGEPEFYEEQRITTNDGLLVSVMLAQRVYFATFRFGILESSGGLGLDLDFFDDSLEVSAEIFRFSDSQLPRLRFRLAYEILPTLFILGGADDVLNERTVDFFLGAMLRFDDNDLVSLLPIFGGAVGSAAN
jgi:phospholipid/cholesterol/gamma-HCH transport system substrate-binding protein